MSDLTKIFVFLTTAKSPAKSVGSDSRMRLVYQDRVRREFELGGQPHDEREPNRTDLYEFSINSAGVDIDEVRPEHFKIVAAGDDAWLPRSIFINGKSANGEFKVLVGNESWPENAWFSTQSSDASGRAEKARLLDRQGTPTIS